MSAADADVASVQIDCDLTASLFADIAALGERDYPEIGVPTFLISEERQGVNPAHATPAHLTRCRSTSPHLPQPCRQANRR